MSKRMFKWESWNFDLDGDAYVIAKAECPDKENVPQYIVSEDNLSPDCKAEMVVQEGWCKWMVRSDWENECGECEPHGGYYVELGTREPIRSNGKRKPGWFPVWIVRKEEWY